MGEALAQEFDIDFFETSAKTGSFVEDAFIQISRQVKDRLEKEKPVGNSAETAPVGIVKANKVRRSNREEDSSLPFSKRGPLPCLSVCSLCP